MDGQRASLDDFDDALVVVVCPDAKDRALSVSPGNELWLQAAFTTSPNLKMHPPMHQRLRLHPSQPSLTRTSNPDLSQRRLADPGLSRPRLSGRAAGGDGLHAGMALLVNGSGHQKQWQKEILILGEQPPHFSM